MLFLIPAAVGGYFTWGALEEWWASERDSLRGSAVAIVAMLVIGLVLVAWALGNAAVKSGASRRGGAAYRAVQAVEKLGMGGYRLVADLYKSTVGPVVKLVGL